MRGQPSTAGHMAWVTGQSDAGRPQSQAGGWEAEGCRACSTWGQVVAPLEEGSQGGVSGEGHSNGAGLGCCQLRECGSGRRLQRAAHSLPSLAGPGAADSSQTKARAATSTRLARRLQGTFASSSNMAAPLFQFCTEGRRPGRVARRRRRSLRPPLAVTGQGRAPRTRSRGGAAVGGSDSTRLSLRPP